MRPAVDVCIRPVSSAALSDFIPALADLLSDAVNGGASLGFVPTMTAGASLGFVPTMTAGAARRYWRSLRSEMEAGTRVVLGAFHDGRIVGSGQLALSAWPNASHRAEIQKLFVDGALRGQGVGRSLMAALHETARRHGRSLVLLNAAHGGAAERFYKSLGYREVGVIPGYIVGPERERIDSVTLYQEIGG